MTTMEILGEEYIRTEIDKIEKRLAIYQELYENSQIKCLILRRLITTKKEELRLLQALQ